MSQGTRLSTKEAVNPMPTELNAVQPAPEQSFSKIRIPFAQESDDLIEELKKYLHE